MIAIDNILYAVTPWGFIRMGEDELFKPREHPRPIKPYREPILVPPNVPIIA